MSYKVQPKHAVDNQVLDPFADGVAAPLKVDPAVVKRKVSEILSAPCIVDTKKLVQRATYGNAIVQSKIKQ